MSEDHTLRCTRVNAIRRVTRFAMRGERVEEASNPGPRYSLRKRQSVVDVSGDSNGEASASAMRDANTIEDPVTSLSNSNAKRFTPLALQSDDDAVSLISRPHRITFGVKAVSKQC